MTHLSTIERLRNTIRQHQASIEMGDADPASFSPNVDDVKDLLQAYKELRAISEDVVSSSSNPVRMAFVPHLIRLVRRKCEECDNKLGVI